MTATERDKILKALEPGKTVWIGDSIIAHKATSGTVGSDKYVTYGYQFRDNGRFKRRLGCKTITEARNKLSAARDDARARRNGDRRELERIGFDKFADQYLAAKVDKRSIDEKRRVVARLVNHFGNTPVNCITRADVIAYRDKRKNEKRPRTKRRLKTNTINNEIAELSSMLSYAVDCNRVEYNVALKAKLQRVEHEIYAISDYEEAEILKAAAPHIRPIIIVAVETALRIGELLVLDWQRVNVKERTITVAETRTRREGKWTVGPPKSGKVRRVVLTDRALEALRTLKPRPAGRVFTYRGAPIWEIKKGWECARKTAAKALKRPIYRDKDGYLRPRIHDTRSTAITRMIAAGANRFDVRDIAGHSSIKVTERYIQWVEDHSDLVERMNKRRTSDTICSQQEVSLARRIGLTP